MDVKVPMDAPVTDSTTQHGTNHVRDSNYYFDDGSVVLLVENRLFKIHKSLFERSSAFFRTLFSLLQGTDANNNDLNRVEGRSDETPIVCQDSVDDFEALCWAIYASPPEILAQQIPDTVNVAKMISVVAMSHKYDFTVLREWALGVLHTYSTTSSESIIKKWCQWSNARRIFILANQCKKEALIQCIERDWLKHIYDSGSNDLTAFEQALDLAEHSHDLHTFHGKVYYTFLKATNIFDIEAERDIRPLDIKGVATYMDPLLKLSHERKLRISQGFWSLSLLRPQLLQAPWLDDDFPCPAHTYCESNWQTWWADVLEVMECSGRCPNNPGEIIEEVQRRMLDPSSFVDIVECDELVQVQVVQMAQGFFDSLADRFMIP